MMELVDDFDSMVENWESPGLVCILSKWITKLALANVYEKTMYGIWFEFNVCYYKLKNRPKK